MANPTMPAKPAMIIGIGLQQQLTAFPARAKNCSSGDGPFWMLLSETYWRGKEAPKAYCRSCLVL
jgi:hypothetical protein